MCSLSDPIMITPFHSPGSPGPSYDFQGTCEHILVMPCNNQPEVAVVGDFSSEDISMGRVGLRNGSKAVVLTEKLGLELRGGLVSFGTNMVTRTNLGSLEVVVNVATGNLRLGAAFIGSSITQTNTSVSINLANKNNFMQARGLCGNNSGALVFRDREQV